MRDDQFSEEYLHHPSLPGRISGPENARRNFSSMCDRFPGIRVSLESMVAIGVTLSATHRPPTGKHAAWPVMVFSRFAEGKVADNWLVTDSGQLESQLG